MDSRDAASHPIDYRAAHSELDAECYQRSSVDVDSSGHVRRRRYRSRCRAADAVNNILMTIACLYGVYGNGEHAVAKFF